MLAIAVVITVLPFLQSMKPSAEAINRLPRIKLTGIGPGDYRLLSYIPRLTDHDDWEITAFVYKKNNGELRVWRLLAKNGAVGMPDLRWLRPLVECKNFGPTVVNGVVDESKPITCHDDGVSAYWRQEWRWSIDGKNMGKTVEDMDALSGSIEGDYFVIQNSG